MRGLAALLVAGLALGCGDETTIGEGTDAGGGFDAGPLGTEDAGADGEDAGAGDTDGGTDGGDGGALADAGSGGGDDGGSSGADGGPVVDGGVCPPDGCDDSDACTADSCGPSGCVFELVDGDGDGYAPSHLDPSACMDCNDTEMDASPDQRAFFDRPHTIPGGGTSSYDWNCDGTEERRWTGFGTDCGVGPGGGCTGDGWVGVDGVPPCGTAQTYRRCVPSSSAGCVPREGPRTQECR